MSGVFHQDESLFADALARPEDERAAFLDRACQGDPTLKARIVALLAAHAQKETPFDVPLYPGAGMQEEKPGDIIDRYKLLQKIGEGGCGVVWMAEQEAPVRRRVALKVIKLGMDTKAVVARFQAERQALALMNHPNIARVYDGGVTERGRPFFVMELVRGISITKYCDENHLTPNARLELFVRVCQAVQHAHQKGIIHRDLKPSNILVTLNDGVETPKVIDFGIAKATQGRLTDSTVFTAFEQFIGTPVYMSPEQAEMSSLDIDTRSDIYSLGVLLYELLAGRPPFDPDALAKGGVDVIRQQIRETEPPRPSLRFRTLGDEERTTVARSRSTVPSDLSIMLRSDLDWIVMRCIEKDRTRRYPTANGLAVDIQRYLDSEPVTARPPSKVYLLQKLIRRHRMGVLATAMVVTALVAGFGVSIWALWHERAARERAVAAEREQDRQRGIALFAQANEKQLRREAEKNELVARRRAYAADMGHVQRELALDNLGGALKLLNRHRPQAGQADVRGWEWRYLWKLCRSDAQAVVSETNRRIGSVAASPDGRWLAVAGIDTGGVSVFDLETGEEISVPAGDGYVWVAASPTEPLIAVAAVEGASGSRPRYRVFLWNIATRQKERDIPLAYFCGRMLFSADGRQLMTAANELAVWRVSDGKKLSARAFPANTSRPGMHVPFAASSDFAFAAVVTRANNVCVVDLSTGKARWERAAARDIVTALAFSPDGKQLLSGAGYDEAGLRLWDVNSGEELGAFEGHHRLIQSLVFWPDGKTFASAAGDQTIRVWDVESRRLVRTLRGHKQEVWALTLLGNGPRLASGGKDGSVYLWDTSKPPARRGPIVLEQPTLAWRIMANDASIITVDGRGVVEGWIGRDFQEKTTLAELGPCGGAFFSADGGTIVTSGYGAGAEIWDWAWQRLTARVTVFGPFSPFALVEGGKTLVAAGAEQGSSRWSRVGKWSIATGQAKDSWPVRPILSDRGVAVSPDERWLLIGSLSSGYEIIDWATNTVAARSPRGCRGPAFSADSRFVAIPSPNDSLTCIWDLNARREVARLEATSLKAVHSAAFSPDGRRLAVTGGGQEAIKLWDVPSFEPLIGLDVVGSTSLTQTAFSPSGNILGAYFGKQQLHLWCAPSWQEIEASERAAAQRR